MLNGFFEMVKLIRKASLVPNIIVWGGMFYVLVLGIVLIYNIFTSNKEKN